MNLYIVLGAALAVSVWTAGVYFEGRSVGAEEVTAENAVAIQARDAKIAKLESEHQAAIKVFQSKVHKVRVQDNEKIRKLLLENETLRNWWGLDLPADVVEYAWGLRNSAGDRSVPR